MEAGGHDHDRDDADGHVHVEDPAPREVGDEEAAEQRAGHRRDREDGADQAHVATALARRDDVGDDRLRADHEAAGPDPLQRAEADQLGHRLREPREHRAGEEDQDRHEEDGLAPVHVAELAVDRRRDRRGEQVRGDDPGEVVEPAEVADDGRQRNRDDRLVERGEEHAEHQRDEHRAQRRAGQPPVLLHLPRVRARTRVSVSDGPFDDEDVLRRVDVVGQHPVDDAPPPRAVGQLEDLADLRLTHGMGGAEAGGELRCVELTGLAFADAPDDTGHGSMFARGA